jgi:hypothetical protein
VRKTWDQATERVRHWLRRKHDYDACFRTNGVEMSKAGVGVLRDIAQFCGAYKSTAKVSPVQREVDVHAMLIAEGRRQVYLHIQRRLRLTDDQILNMMEEAHE